MKYNFYFSDTYNFGEQQTQISKTLVRCLEAKKNFCVSFELIGEDKTHPQLKAIYKLFQKALPNFREWKPQVDWSLEMIKEFSKTELGYIRQPNQFEIALMIKQSGFTPKDQIEKRKMVNFCKKIKHNISFADFSKEQLYNFTKEFEVWCQTANGDKPAWVNVYLEESDKTNK